MREHEQDNLALCWSGPSNLQSHMALSLFINYAQALQPVKGTLVQHALRNQSEDAILQPTSE